MHKKILFAYLSRGKTPFPETVSSNFPSMSDRLYDIWALAIRNHVLWLNLEEDFVGVIAGHLGTTVVVW